MKDKICAFVIGISLFLIVGIVGGVDCGEPVTNLAWCVPLVAALGAAVVVSNS